MNKPLWQATGAIALLVAMDALIKAQVATLPVVEITFLRYGIGSLVMVAVAAVARPGWPSRKTLGANAVRALLVIVTALSYFTALGLLPLAEALVLTFVSPTITALLAALWLGERPDPRILLALGAGFAGVLLIAFLGLAPTSGCAASEACGFLGLGAALVSAVGYSASNVLLRARAKRDPIVTIVLLQNVVPAALLAGPAALGWTAPDRTGWLFALGIGALGAAGHLLLATAYARAEATRLAPLDYTALIWAAALGFAAFGEVPNAAVIAGAVLIVGSALLTARPRRSAVDSSGSSH